MRKENENENEKKEGNETYALGHKDFQCYRPVLKDLLVLGNLTGTKWHVIQYRPSDTGRLPGINRGLQTGTNGNISSSVEQDVCHTFFFPFIMSLVSGALTGTSVATNLTTKREKKHSWQAG